jgi:hypothetical protein
MAVYSHFFSWRLTKFMEPPEVGTDDLLNVRPNSLEVGKNFFSRSVAENWSEIPSHVKM